VQDSKAITRERISSARAGNNDECGYELLIIIPVIAHFSRLERTKYREEGLVKSLGSNHCERVFCCLEENVGQVILKNESNKEKERKAAFNKENLKYISNASPRNKTLEVSERIICLIRSLHGHAHRQLIYTLLYL
jgi:hypothetical protein